MVPPCAVTRKARERWGLWGKQWRKSALFVFRLDCSEKWSDESSKGDGRGEGEVSTTTENIHVEEEV
ncbi:MAG: hypothetical protein SF187_23720 [Deltaproteobacteria bacterium]|nr:hypothetical protein [Deltaproteobacteria bacterium]